MILSTSTTARKPPFLPKIFKFLHNCGDYIPKDSDYQTLFPTAGQGIIRSQTSGVYLKREKMKH